MVVSDLRYATRKCQPKGREAESRTTLALGVEVAEVSGGAMRCMQAGGGAVAAARGRSVGGWVCKRSGHELKVRRAS